MTRYSAALTLLAVTMLLVTIGCVYAQLLSGYSGIGVDGVTVRNDPSLRSMLSLVAIVTWVTSVLSSLLAIRISTGFGRALPAGPLLISLGLLTFAILGAIF
ncbi:hypothetical protein K227x_32590 [Rubripirellula lacrimiformis]|uniref:Uncharacterized protein n=1 Tax=Rubripirellula lacrimiformis TaxID=1930273 RepID=A0A517NCJ5_9BACT|nr:hypothetical protein [Rubripirellula lacrimiformis]QDT03883.1 hypothetical protein K227x_22680 [Rubripirellula lacrimiformis]QDT04862.1 hypothetical protein K227x_32590 [Rubripirellula lacrimiformis]